MKVLALDLGVVRGGTRRSTWLAGSCKEHVQDISPGVVQGIERQVASEPEACAVFEGCGKLGLLTCVCATFRSTVRGLPMLCVLKTNDFMI